MRQYIIVTILNAILIASIAPAQENAHIEEIGTLHDFWQGSYDVEIVDNIAYVATAYRIYLMDISDINNPTPIDSYPVLANSLYYTGRYLIAHCWKNVTIMLIEEDGSLTSVQYFRLPYAETSVAGSDELICLASREYDYWDDEWNGQWYYNLSLWNISDPDSIFLAGALNRFYRPMKFGEDKIYCLGDGQDLHVFRTDSLPNFPLVGTVERIGTYDFIEIDELFYFKREDDIVIADLGDPWDPQILYTYDSPSGPGWIKMNGDHVYCASYDSGMVVWEITVGDSLIPSGKLPYDIRMTSFDVDGDVGAVTDVSNRIQLLDLSDREDPEFAGIYRGAGRALDVVRNGDIVYTAANDRGIMISDISEINAPVEVAEYVYDADVYRFEDNLSDIHRDNSLLFAAVTDCTILVFDIDNHDTLNQLSSIHFEGVVQDMVWYFNRLYVVSSDDKMLFYSFEDPEQPELEGEYPIEEIEYPSSLTVYEDIAYVGGIGNVIILNLYDPDEITYEGDLKIRGCASEIIAGESILIIADQRTVTEYETSLWAYDLFSPVNPEFLGNRSFSQIGTIERMHLDEEDEILYLSLAELGVAMLSTSDLRDIALLGFHQTEGISNGIEFDFPYLFVADYWDIAIYDCSEALTVTTPHHDNVSSFEFRSIFPNPFNSAATITYSINKPGVISLSLYDTNGRDLKLLMSEYRERGSYEFRLHGKDLAAGIYFIGIENDLSRKFHKFTVLK